MELNNISEIDNIEIQPIVGEDDIKNLNKEIEEKKL